MRFKGQWCLAMGEPSMKERILDEAQSSKFFVHPRGDKMYSDFTLMFWWSWIIKGITEYVSCCLSCQKVKSIHKQSGGLIQPLEILV